MSSSADATADQAHEMMKDVADQTLTGGESATGGTWVIKLKAANLKGKVDTVPVWCRSLRSAPDKCSCESPLRTE